MDGDNDYLEKCLKFYKKNRLKAFGIYSKENEIVDAVRVNLEKYNPDILVITGHDAYYRKKRKDNNYKNTSNFVDAVKESTKDRMKNL